MEKPTRWYGYVNMIRKKYGRNLTGLDVEKEIAKYRRELESKAGSEGDSIAGLAEIAYAEIRLLREIGHNGRADILGEKFRKNGAFARAFDDRDLDEAIYRNVLSSNVDNWKLVEKRTSSRDSGGAIKNFLRQTISGIASNELELILTREEISMIVITETGEQVTTGSTEEYTALSVFRRNPFVKTGTDVKTYYEMALKRLKEAKKK